MRANMGDSHKNLQLQNFSSVLTDAVNRRSNVGDVSVSENAILKSSNARLLRPCPTFACRRRRSNVVDEVNFKQSTLFTKLIGRKQEKNKYNKYKEKEKKTNND